MLLRKPLNTKNKKPSTKSLSLSSRIINQFVNHIPLHNNSAKALQCGRRSSGSLTVEAALTVPVFLMVMVLFMGFFNVLQVETVVSAGMHYSARIMAVSYQSEHLLGETKAKDDASSMEKVATSAIGLIKDIGGQVISRTEGRLLFNSYVKEHGLDESMIVNGLSGVSFLTSDLSGDYIKLRASYRVKLPIAVVGMDSLPVRQSVIAKKWNGASKDDKSEEEETEYVYVTPNGSVYHTSDTCSHIKLSLRTVLKSKVDGLRNKDGAIYYPCSCFNPRNPLVYVTDYGTEYHSSTACGNIKRTVVRKSKDEVGSMRACSKCGK